MSDDILAADPAITTNGQLMAAVDRLGWLGRDVLDLTYGLGKFWTEVEPVALLANDANPEKGTTSHDVLTPIPDLWALGFDSVVYDPPYRMSGKPDNAMGDRYGIDVARTRDQIIELLQVGTVFARGCTRPGGTFFVKCQNTQNSGRYINQEQIVIDAAMSSAFAPDVELLGRFLLITKPQKQPANREQRTPRNNVSALLAFRRHGDETLPIGES